GPDPVFVWPQGGEVPFPRYVPQIGRAILPSRRHQLPVRTEGHTGEPFILAGARPCRFFQLLPLPGRQVPEDDRAIVAAAAQQVALLVRAEGDSRDRLVPFARKRRADLLSGDIP